LARGSIARPEIAAPIERQPVRPWDTLRVNSRSGRVLYIRIKEINDSGSAISDVQILGLIKRNSGKTTVPARGHNESDFDQFGVVNVDLPNGAGRRPRTTGIQIAVIISRQSLNRSRCRDERCETRILRKLRWRICPGERRTETKNERGKQCHNGSFFHSCLFQNVIRVLY
jgi:hypothetical protein